MEILLNRKVISTGRTKAICGLNKRELLEKFESSVHQYKLKSAIETTTYIHHFGYYSEWWDIVFTIMLKHVHVNLYGHYSTIMNYYDTYLKKKQNNEAIATNQNIGWQMCWIASVLTILDKSSILTRDQIKSLPFYHFIMHEGTARPHKLRIIHDNIVNCIDDIVETNDVNELIQLLHYVLREDYGHNKYVPILMDKLLEISSYHKTREMCVLKELYSHIKGNKRFLTLMVIAFMYLFDNLPKTDLGRFEEQARYFYGKYLQKIKKFYTSKAVSRRERIPPPTEYTSPTVENLRADRYIPQQPVQEPVPKPVPEPVAVPSEVLNDEPFTFEPVPKPVAVPSEVLSDEPFTFEPLDEILEPLEELRLDDEKVCEVVEETKQNNRPQKIRIIKL